LGPPTRRYHGLLVAALAAPLGRVVLLNHVRESITSAERLEVDLSGTVPGPQGAAPVALSEFRLEQGLPVWRYETPFAVLEKRVFMPHLQNTVHVLYRVVDGARITLRLRPFVSFRPLEHPVDEPLAEPHVITVAGDRYSLKDASACPPLEMAMTPPRTSFVLERTKSPDVWFPLEAARGYPARGALWSPGYFWIELNAHESIGLTASTESWEVVSAHTPEDALVAEYERRDRLLSRAVPKAQQYLSAELVLASDQFVITPAGRVEEAARARTAGDEARTVIAGYHWFTDWGRDTMVSLEGLTLVTGRYEEAGYILRTFARYVRDGLIPNLFPEGRKEGLYHTADATLWFFHALACYLDITRDRETLRIILPKLLEIIMRHVEGTRFGIGVDARDGLLRQGAPGYQLTWMDAKVGDWVVTPRRGKAVEINALWYNALRLMEQWLREENDHANAERMAGQAQQTCQSFNARFWYAQGGYLYDVVDGEQGDDPACRPNQLLAISLAHPVLGPERWRSVVDTARERLLTPVGLRSLAPGHRDYKDRYDGDLRARDAAYHQGTVWAWLIGPFIDAWLKVYPEDRAGAHRLLEGFDHHLNEGCVGSVSEIFDATGPYTPRGCVAQAWSVAEVLRCLVKTAS
ncbi:MAG TPA: amylo-alpha-1,6-glucosidase, partial [Burkholderiales bacterium]|nr:amylo-alpha-1,6-glucosidase [Burkholderiales bacterium]